MKGEIGTADFGRIDRFLENVREIERRIQLVEERNSSGDERELPGAPAGVPDSFSEHMQLMFDLQVLAFKTDMTRVVSFKIGRDASNRTLPESGSDKGFHPSSHHGDNVEAIKAFNTICKYRMSQMAYFLEQLENTSDGATSLLDQSMIIWGSPMGDANVHNHRRCPLVLLGGANGAHRGGVCNRDCGLPGVRPTWLGRTGGGFRLWSCCGIAVPGDFAGHIFQAGKQAGCYCRHAARPDFHIWVH